MGVLVVLALNLAMLFAAWELAAAGRAPARFRGFAWVMAVSSLVLYLWGHYMSYLAFDASRDLAVGQRSMALQEGLGGAMVVSLVGAAVPVVMLAVTGILAVKRRPPEPVPEARLVERQRPASRAS
jgi:hypothetical protein